jgi:Avidin family
MALTGVWMNELNSIMVLKDDGDGRLSGKYRSIAGRDPHIPGSDERGCAGREAASERRRKAGEISYHFGIVWCIKTVESISWHSKKSL